MSLIRTKLTLFTVNNRLRLFNCNSRSCSDTVRAHYVVCIFCRVTTDRIEVFAEAISKEISYSTLRGQKNNDNWYLEECTQLFLFTHKPAT